MISDQFDHLLCRTALETAVVLLWYRVESVLYHVFSPHTVQSLWYTRPFCAKLTRKSEKLGVFFDGPLIMVDDGVEMIVPHFPAVVGSSEELLVRPTVEIVADVTPFPFEAIFPEWKNSYLRISRNIFFSYCDHSSFLPLGWRWRQRRLYSIKIGFFFLKMLAMNSRLWCFYIDRFGTNSLISLLMEKA